LGQLAIKKAVTQFTKRSNACVKASSEHFESSQSLANCIMLFEWQWIFLQRQCLSFCTHSAACKREKWRCGHRKKL